MINKGIGCCQLCLCFAYGCEDDRDVLVAFVFLAMRCYVCALLGAVLARVAFVLLLPLRRSEQFFCSFAVLLFLFATCSYYVLYIHTCILT